MQLITERTFHSGYTIEIVINDDPIDPREDENLGTMVCFHRRYTLGDKNYFPKGSDFKDIDEFEKWFFENQKDLIYLPLYLLDHSGIMMSTSSFNNHWDSGQIGYIFVDKEKVKKEFNKNRISVKLHKRIHEILKAEVTVYNKYLCNEIYGFLVKDKDGDVIDSCWNFFDEDECLSEAKMSAENEKEKNIKHHLSQLKVWIKNKVQEQYRYPCPFQS